MLDVYLLHYKTIRIVLVSWVEVAGQRTDLDQFNHVDVCQTVKHAERDKLNYSILFRFF